MRVVNDLNRGSNNYCSQNSPSFGALKSIQCKGAFNLNNHPNEVLWIMRAFRNPDEISKLYKKYDVETVKGIDKVTGKKIALRDDKGIKLVNRVRNIKKDNFLVTDTLNFNVTRIVTAKDTNSRQVIAKEVAKSTYQGLDYFKSSFENGKVKAVRQFSYKSTNGKLKSISEIFWFGRNSEGKLNKKVFKDVLDYPIQQEVKKFVAENCPELRD